MNDEQEKFLEGLSDSVKEAIRYRVDELGMTIQEALFEVLSCGDAGVAGATA